MRSVCAIAVGAVAGLALFLGATYAWLMGWAPQFEDQLHHLLDVEP